MVYLYNHVALGAETWFFSQPCILLFNTVAGPYGAMTSAAGSLGKVSGGVECCFPGAAVAAGSTRTWA